MKITLSEDEALHLAGRIDRLDLCEDETHVYVKILIIIRKSSLTGSLYYGLQLQLVVYRMRPWRRSSGFIREKKRFLREPPFLLGKREKHLTFPKDSWYSKTESMSKGCLKGGKPPMERETSCCFTGHRNIPAQDGCGSGADCGRKFSGWQNRGVHSFLAGGALGFDTMAAQEVLRVRGRICPFSGTGAGVALLGSGGGLESTGCGCIPESVAAGGSSDLYGNPMSARLHDAPEPVLGRTQCLLPLLPEEGPGRHRLYGPVRQGSRG